MKKVIATFIIAMFTVSLHAVAQEAPKTTWQEKDEFHKVMAETFHPMEEGNLEPIKTRSQELFDKAMAWQNSKIPADLDGQKIASTMRTMVAQIRELNAKIKSGKATDAEIKTELTKAHDSFHEIVGLCNPGKHDHHGHDHSDPNHKH
jgi:hypothetical protein